MQQRLLGNSLKDNSIILIDKPSGISSFGVVAKTRRLLSEQLGKKAKVGHTGTLDPFATGLMILVTGQMCKQAQSFSKLDKTYETTFVLGKTTSTADIEGKICLRNRQQPSFQTLKLALDRFCGLISQTPPIFSAIKINGQRAYQLARRGQIIDMPERHVTVYDLELLSYHYPRVKLRLRVSSGTYIRSLAVDLGRVLGTGAYCFKLRRTQIAEFRVEQAWQLDS